MPKNINTQSIRDKVLQAIESGRVKMRPRWQFVLKAALVAVGIAIIGLVLLYLASFIVFAMRQSGAWFMPAFGFRGVFVMLKALPWLLILLSAAFVIILELLVRRYAFAYRRPLLYSAAAIIILAFLGTAVIARTTAHRGLFLRAQEHRMPFGGEVYRSYGMHRAENIHPGMIMELSEEGFKMQERRGDTFRVRVTNETEFPMGMEFAPGDAVVVFGELDGGAVQAMGIRRVEGEFFGSVTAWPRMPMHEPGTRMRLRFMPVWR